MQDKESGEVEHRAKEDGWKSLNPLVDVTECLSSSCHPASDISKHNLATTEPLEREELRHQWITEQPSHVVHVLARTHRLQCIPQLPLVSIRCPHSIQVYVEESFPWE